MAKPNEKLAESLDALKNLQEDGKHVFRSDELSRVHRERLVSNGFLLEVMKGWLISAGPSVREGDSTPWYASFWEFCSRYCNERFKDDWHLSPEQSLLIHGEKAVIPEQAVVYSPRGTNNTVTLSARSRQCLLLTPSEGRPCRPPAECSSHPGRGFAGLHLPCPQC